MFAPFNIQLNNISEPFLKEARSGTTVQWQGMYFPPSVLHDSKHFIMAAQEAAHSQLISRPVPVT